MKCRKNVKRLTTDERRRFIAAIVALRDAATHPSITRPGLQSRYDDFAQMRVLAATAQQNAPFVAAMPTPRRKSSMASRARESFERAAGDRSVGDRPYWDGDGEQLADPGWRTGAPTSSPSDLMFWLVRERRSRLAHLADAPSVAVDNGTAPSRESTIGAFPAIACGTIPMSPSRSRRSVTFVMCRQGLRRTARRASHHAAGDTRVSVRPRHSHFRWERSSSSNRARARITQSASCGSRSPPRMRHPRQGSRYSRTSSTRTPSTRASPAANVRSGLR